MKKVLIITKFEDRYTGEVYEAGTVRTMSEERIAEIKSVADYLIEVVGEVEEVTSEAKSTEAGPKKKAKKKPE